MSEARGSGPSTAEPTIEHGAGQATELLGPPIDRGAIAAMPAEQLVMRYRQGLGFLDPRAFELETDQADRAFLDGAGVGRWPVRVLLWHLADCESLYRWRAVRVLSEDHPVLEAWDEDAPIDAGLYGAGMPMTQLAAPGTTPTTISPPLGAAGALIYTLRETFAATLIQLPETAWQRRGLHAQRGEMTLRQIIDSAVWHLEHHARFLNAKCTLMLGPRPAESGCCGGGHCEGRGDGSCGNPDCGHDHHDHEH